MSLNRVAKNLDQISVDIEETTYHSKYFNIYDIRDEYSTGLHLITVRGTKELKNGSYIYVEIKHENGRTIPISVPLATEYEKTMLPLSRFTFEVVDENFRGTWQEGVFYNISDFVKFNGILYKCLSSHESSISIDPSNVSYWERSSLSESDIRVPDGNCTITFVGTTLDDKLVRYQRSFAINTKIPPREIHDRGDWEEGEYYEFSDLVKYNGTIYKSILPHESSQDISPPDSTYWRVFTSDGADVRIVFETGNQFVLDTDGDPTIDPVIASYLSQNFDPNINTIKWYRKDESDDWTEISGETGETLEISYNQFESWKVTNEYISIKFSVADQDGVFYEDIATVTQVEAGINARIVRIEASSQIVKEDQDGNTDPSELTLEPILENITGDITWYYDNTVVSSTSTGDDIYVDGSDNLIIKKEAIIDNHPVLLEVNGLTDKLRVYRLLEGKDTFNGILDKEQFAVATDSSGNILSGELDNVESEITIYRGIENVTNEYSYSYSLIPSGGGTVTQKGTNNNIFSIDSMSADNLTVVIEANHVDYPTITKSFSIVKQRQGERGFHGLSLLYRGYWDTNVTYYRTAVATDVVERIDASDDLSYFYLPEGETESTGDDPLLGDPWEEFDSFEAIATDILLAKDVTIRRTLTMGIPGEGLEESGGIIQSLGGFDASDVPTTTQENIVRRFYKLTSEGISAYRGEIGGLTLEDNELKFVENSIDTFLITPTRDVLSIDSGDSPIYAQDLKELETITDSNDWTGDYYESEEIHEFPEADSVTKNAPLLYTFDVTEHSGNHYDIYIEGKDSDNVWRNLLYVSGEAPLEYSGSVDSFGYVNFRIRIVVYSSQKGKNLKLEHIVISRYKSKLTINKDGIFQAISPDRILSLASGGVEGTGSGIVFWENIVGTLNLSEAELGGTLDVQYGGTGRSDLTQGSYLIGNEKNDVLLKTPAQVLDDISAVPTSRNLTIQGTSANRISVNENVTQNLENDRIWTLDLPQDIDEGANVTFNQLTTQGNVSIGGDLEVLGDETIFDTETVQTEATHILVNKNGSDLSANGSGVRVERVGDDGSLVYDQYVTSLWKAGNIGSEIELVNVSSTQTLTNKTGDKDLIGTDDQVSVDSGSNVLLGNDVTLSLPQDIHTLAVPTFNQVTANNSSTDNNHVVRADSTVTLTGKENQIYIDFDTNQLSLEENFVSNNPSFTLELPQDIHAQATPDFTQLIIGSQATITDHAVRADRSITINNDSDSVITWSEETSGTNLTSDRSWTPVIADHGDNQRGIINTIAQDIYGEKTFLNKLTINNSSYENHLELVRDTLQYRLNPSTGNNSGSANELRFESPSNNNRYWFDGVISGNSININADEVISTDRDFTGRHLELFGVATQTLLQFEDRWTLKDNKSNSYFEFINGENTSWRVTENENRFEFVQSLPQSSDWNNRLQGWGEKADPRGRGYFDFRGIYADEMIVRTFISETTLSLAGSDFLTKSNASVSEPIVIDSLENPITITVDDHEGLKGFGVFDEGDYLRLRIHNRFETGEFDLVIMDLWGKATNYVDNEDGTQQWTVDIEFPETLPVSQVSLQAGSVVLDYGKSGDGVIERSALGAGTPYDRIFTWSDKPWISSNYEVKTQIGALGNTGGYYSEEFLEYRDAVEDDGGEIIDTEATAQYFNSQNPQQIFGGYFKDQIMIQVGDENTMNIGKNVGGLGRHGYRIDGNNYHYGTGEFKVFTDEQNFIDKTETQLTIKSETFDLQAGTMTIKSDEGIRLDDNNYWFNTGAFEIGDGDHYIKQDGNGNIDIDSESFNLEAGSLKILGDTTNSYIRLGDLTGIDDTTNKGTYIDNSGNILLRENNNNYLKKDTSGLDIKSQIFNLEAGSLKILGSGASSYIRLGSLTGIDDTTNSGTYINNSGEFLIRTNGSNYLKRDTNGLDIKSNIFNLTSGNLTLQSGSGTASLSIDTMKLGEEVSGIDPNTNDGLFIADHNYWYTTGEFKTGGNDNFIYHDGNGNINIETDKFDLEAGSLRILGDTANSYIKLGEINEIGNEVYEGVFINNSGEISIYGDDNNLIRRQGTSLDIKSQTFNLEVADRIILDSSGDNGIFFIGNKTDDTYIEWDDGNLVVQTDNFSIDNLGNVTVSGDISGSTGTFSGTVSGGDININDNFIVDTDGKLISGNIDQNNVTLSESEIIINHYGASLQQNEALKIYPVSGGSELITNFEIAEEMWISTLGGSGNIAKFQYIEDENTNNKIIFGADLFVTGNITFSGEGSIIIDEEVTGDFTPATDNIYVLGTSEKRWKEIHASESYFGGVFETGLKSENIKEYETGTVLVWNNGKLMPCNKKEDKKVQGIAKIGKEFPIVMGAEPVLVTGKVKEGDYLTTSTVEGHAQKIKESYFGFIPRNISGKVIAQALEDSDGSKSCKIKAMISKI